VGGTVPPVLRAVVLGVLLVAPGGASAQSDRTTPPVNGGLYRRPLGHDPATLDPARIADVYSRSVAQQLFDGLVHFDRTLTIAPALAEFWKASRDGLTWTFTLRKGVKFHHGREVAATDVVYSLSRLLDPKTKSGAANLLRNVKGARDFRDGRTRSVAGFRALDRYTVQVTLDEAQVPFVSVLAVGHAKILPRELVESDPVSFAVHPVGTGPFKFVRWDRGKEIVLAANPDYFDGAPHLAGVVYRIYPGELWDRAYEEFRKGKLEDAPLPSQNYRQAVAAPNQIYVKRPMISLRFYGFNTRLKPLDDRRVRQAIIRAIDREALNEEAFAGRYAPARGILPPGTLGFNPALRGYPHDPIGARQLLAEAGYPGGRGVPPLAIWSGVRLEAVTHELEMITRDLAAVGIRTEIHYETDWPRFSQLLEEHRLPMFPYAWYADVPDPDNFLFELFHSRSPRNFFGYANPLVDQLLFSARQVGDATRRVELYRRAEQTILDDAPVIPISHHTYERVFQPYVRSVEVNGLGDPYIPLRKIRLERLR
jgi:peptide/nickel transport system substrate-binding protein